MLTAHELERRFRESMANGWLSEALYAQELLTGQGFDLAAIGPSPSGALDCIDQFPYFVDERDYYQADKTLVRMETEFRAFIEQLDAGAVGLVREARRRWQVARDGVVSGDLQGALAAYEQLETDGWLKGRLRIERNRVDVALQIIALEGKARETRPDDAQPWQREQIAVLGTLYDAVVALEDWDDENVARSKQALGQMLSSKATQGLVTLAEALLKDDDYNGARELLGAFAQVKAIRGSDLRDLRRCVQEQEEILFAQAVAQANGCRGRRDFVQEQAALHEALTHNRWSERAKTQLREAEEHAARQEALLKRLGELNEECSTRYGSHDFNGALAVARRYVALCQEREAVALLPSDDLARLAANGRVLVKQCKSRRFVHYATGEFLLDKLLGS